MTQQVWAAYVSGLLSGLFALFAFWLNSRSEQAKLVAAEHREDFIWFRNAIADAYSQAIYYLFKLSMSSAAAVPDQKEVRQHLSESQRYLLLLHAYHAESETKAKLLVAVNDLDTSAKLSDSATKGLQLARLLFTTDGRINVRK
jgi:hypothetical protein